jgi:hypothetical protein
MFPYRAKLKLYSSDGYGETGALVAPHNHDTRPSLNPVDIQFFVKLKRVLSVFLYRQPDTVWSLLYIARESFFDCYSFFS